MRFIVPDAGPLILPTVGDRKPEVHLFDTASVTALNGAIAAERPLLVKGEPGVGKSQLAHAAAAVLRMPLLVHVVDSRTDAHDLLWRFDAVQRLAEAQVIQHLSGMVDPKERLAVSRFVRPGPLWWAFDWSGAADQAKVVGDIQPDPPIDWKPGDGVVVLIDEIDKAESDVPNGLLEALGAARFLPVGMKEPVTVSGQPPLVVITTNEERAMPDAFVRRCLSLNMTLPKEREELVALLVERGRANFPEFDDAFLAEAAEMLWKDRAEAKLRKAKPLPGQAEYLDLLRAVRGLAPEPERRSEVMAELRPYVLRKTEDRVE